ncbi:putative Cathepsin B [Paratrimastix pyriformis]|uniref:Cathepsin B n=1 Tax=Paratrimastix pyriformis TaxID=342808 RepID=A0ABQ8URC7_9EUKA|nr:putative Cathepsin B [Paratrimastix pyriformis]
MLASWRDRFFIFLFIGSALLYPLSPSDPSLPEELKSMHMTWAARIRPTQSHLPRLLPISYRIPPQLKVNRVSSHPNLVLPEHYDLRDEFPNSLSIHTIKNQVVSECGSCWAHACAGMSGDRLYRVSNGTFNKVMSPQTLMDCDHTCHPNATASGFYCDDGCNGGLLELATQFMVDYGMLTDECISYKCTTPTTCDPLCDDRRTARVPIPAKSMAWCPGERNIMEEIFLHGTVAVVMVFYEDFQYYQSGIYQHVYGTDFGGHVVALIGWGEENGIKYWIARNSEGANWGENGFFRIRRGTNVARIEEDSWVVYYDPPTVSVAAAADEPRDAPAPAPIPVLEAVDLIPSAAALGHGLAMTTPNWAMMRCLADGGALKGRLYDVPAGVSNHCPMVNWPSCMLHSVSIADYNIYSMHQEMYNNPSPGWPTEDCFNAATRYACAVNFQKVTSPELSMDSMQTALPPCRRLCRQFADTCGASGMTTVCAGLPDEPDVDCTMVDPVPYTPTQFGTDGKCPQACVDLRLPSVRAQLGICGEEDMVPTWNYTCVLSLADQAKFARNAFQEWMNSSSAFVQLADASDVCVKSFKRQACARAFPACDGADAGSAVLPLCFSTCTAAMDRCNISPAEASWCLTYQHNEDDSCTGYASPLEVPVEPIPTPIRTGVPAWAAYLIGFLPAGACLAVGLAVGLLIGRRGPRPAVGKGAAAAANDSASLLGNVDVEQALGGRRSPSRRLLTDPTDGE